MERKDWNDRGFRFLHAQTDPLLVASEFQERIPVSVVPFPFYDSEEKRSRS